MAFCNSCGATLNAGIKFCNKCGAPTGMSAPAPSATPAAPTPSSAAATPPPSKGGSSALKIILIVIAVIVGIGFLGMVTCGIVLHRAIKSAHVSQDGKNVKVETPFGNISANDPDQAIKELGVDVYPGAQVQKEGTVAATLFGVHTVTANFESSDPVSKVCDFYKAKFPNANVSSSDQTHCSIVSGEQGNSTSINVQPSGDGSRFQIVAVSKK